MKSRLRALLRAAGVYRAAGSGPPCWPGEFCCSRPRRSRSGVLWWSTGSQDAFVRHILDLRTI